MTLLHEIQTLKLMSKKSQQPNNTSLNVTNFNIFDYRESVMEEIRLFAGLNVKPCGRNSIEIDTIAGKIEYTPMPEIHNVMADVYRFIHHYGIKLSKWGLENKLKVIDNDTTI
jgi:hypothetical protein